MVIDYSETAVLEAVGTDSDDTLRLRQGFVVELLAYLLSLIDEEGHGGLSSSRSGLEPVS